MPAAKRKWWQITCEFVILGLLAIFVLEWFFNVCGIGQQEFLQPDATLGCRHIPGKTVVWRMEGFSNDRLSSSGFRDVEHSLNKPANITRIALLGDSATEGLQVPLGSTFSRVLESELNLNSNSKNEILNFGCSSYSTGQQLLQLQDQVLPYKPDTIVLLYVRGSSLANVRDPSKTNVEPRPYFYLNGKGQLQKDVTAMGSMTSRTNPVIDFLRSNSRIYGVLTQTDLALSIHEKWYRKLRGFVNNAISLTAPRSQQRTQTARYPKPEVWPVTKALITEINYECTRHHMRFILMLFPNTIGDPEYSTQIIELQQMSQQEGFGYLDLTPSFKANPNPNSLFLEYHFSAAGHQLVADELQKYLSSAPAVKSH